MISWEIFLDWSTIINTSLVKKFYNVLKVVTDLGEVLAFVEFKLLGEIRRIEIADLDIMLGMIEFKDKYFADYRGEYKEILSFTKAQ